MMLIRQKNKAKSNNLRINLLIKKRTISQDTILLSNTINNCIHNNKPKDIIYCDYNNVKMITMDNFKTLINNN